MLCPSTPCVVDLPLGRYKLFLSSADGAFENGDTDQLHVRSGVNYYVRAPARVEPPDPFPVGPVVTLVLSGAAMIAGISLLSEDSDAFAPDQVTSYVLLSGSLVGGIAGGIWYHNASRGIEQEGSTTNWLAAGR